MGHAIAAAVKGYKCVFTLPDKMGIEKILLLRAFGAEVIVTPTAVPHESPESYTEVAKRIVRETPNSILANQYYNPRNPEAHYQTTGPGIWEQTGGQIDQIINLPQKRLFRNLLCTSRSINVLCVLLPCVYRIFF